MYIEEVILDGFKSYASRTVVGPFDPSFNAITGLNGSGKSNILDAICFVLGISNLNQVRVQNLQELIYKQGQAGVTKASVTLVFNNKNRAQSPYGYEQYDKITVMRQVAMGGRNKYLINGANAPISRVQNLFHSVQLNVNNPHFLIMQGRIIKVLNMKSTEILGMLEEAAGTRMYETKKQQAMKTIVKKDLKVAEINKILEEEITPTLNNLKTERAQYLKYASNKQESESIKRIIIAYEYTKAKEAIEKSTQSLAEAEEQEQSSAQSLEALQKRKEELKLKIRDMSAEKEKEITAALKGLEEAMNASSQTLAAAKVRRKHAQSSVKEETERKASLEESLKEVADSIAQQEKKLTAAVEQQQEAKAKYDKANAVMADLQRQFETYGLGLSVENGNAESSADLLVRAKAAVSQAITDQKQLTKKIKEAQGELEKLNAKFAASGNEVSKQQEKLKSKEAELEEIVNELKSLSKSEKELAALRKRKRELTGEISVLNGQIVRPPVSGDGVLGMLASFFTPKDTKYLTALQAAAGKSIYNVVVDKQSTGRAILDGKNLRQRVEIIPLDTVSTNVIPDHIIERAKRVGGKEHVNLALALIDYDPKVENAMKYAFGSTFICDDPNSAKAVTFDKTVHSRSVTIAGDLFNPAGTLTAGGNPGNSATFRALLEQKGTLAKLEAKEKELKEVEQQLDEMERKLQRQRELTQRRSVLEHEVAILRDEMKTGKYAKLTQAISDLEAQIKKLEEDKQTKKELEKAEQEKVVQLEAELNGKGKENIEAKMKEIKANMASSKKILDKLTENFKKSDSEQEKLKLELDSLEKERNSVEAQLKANADAIKAALDEEEKENDEVEALQKEYNAAKQQLESKRSEMQQQMSVIKELLKTQRSLTEEESTIKVQLQKDRSVVTRLREEKEGLEAKISEQTRVNTWIREDEKLFGTPGSDYDFAAHSIPELKKKLHQLGEEQEGIAKSINKKVIGMFERAEQEYDDLMKKKEIIVKDKQKIEDVIKELDEKKKEALLATFQKVNKDFGSIFSIVLPGTQAKLVAPEGKTIYDGLEVKVAFDGDWKDNLTELSGGQRSLLALSLILALLVFHPAPMYILDEVDAAMDPAHTQNIGVVLKTHFKQSQFIIVSLKKGMFQNANVLFQTRCVEGVSSVSRSARAKEQDVGPSAPKRTRKE